MSSARLSFLRLVVVCLVRSWVFIAGSIDLKIGETAMREWWRCAGEGMGDGERHFNLKFQISDGRRRWEWRKRGGELTAGKKQIPRVVDAGCVARDDRVKRGGANGGKDGTGTRTLPMNQKREGCGTRESKRQKTHARGRRMGHPKHPRNRKRRGRNPHPSHEPRPGRMRHPGYRKNERRLFSLQARD